MATCRSSRSLFGRICGFRHFGYQWSFHAQKKLSQPQPIPFVPCLGWAWGNGESGEASAGPWAWDEASRLRMELARAKAVPRHALPASIHQQHGMTMGDNQNEYMSR